MGKITKAREKIPGFSRVVTSRVICGPHVGGVDLGRYLPGKGVVGRAGGRSGRSLLSKAATHEPFEGFAQYAGVHCVIAAVTCIRMRSPSSLDEPRGQPVCQHAGVDDLSLSIVPSPLAPPCPEQAEVQAVAGVPLSASVGFGWGSDGAGHGKRCRVRGGCCGAALGAGRVWFGEVTVSASAFLLAKLRQFLCFHILQLILSIAAMR